MSLLSFVIIFFLLAAAGIILWLLWVTVREQAVLRRTLDIVMLQVMLPKDVKAEEKEEGVGDDTKERISVAEQFLSVLSKLSSSSMDRFLYGKPVIVFEIVATGEGTIVFQAGVEKKFIDHLEKQIYALYPEAEVKIAPHYTVFEQGDTVQGGKAHLRHASHLPIATYKELEVDPMQALTGALAQIQDKDAAVIQFVCRPSKERVRKQGKLAARKTVQGLQGDIGSGYKMKATRDALTKTDVQREKAEQRAQQLTPRAQERVELVEQKASQQLFDVNIRIGVATREETEASRIFEGIAAAFSQYDMPDLNAIGVSKSGKGLKFVRDLVFRVPRAKGVSVLSTTELSSLFHFPLPTTETPNILWRGSRVAPAPPNLPKEGVLLGHNSYRGVDTPIHFSPDDRRRHLYMIGQTGTGKTTMFLNMIAQDIRAGRGVGVIDPHGDLIEDILLMVPPERQEDVILFDPRDSERPLGFNILEVRDEAQKDLIVNEVVQILQKLAARLNPESIGPMFEHYLRNALLALIEDPDATLIDVPRMFVDDKFRQAVLARNDNPTVKQFWEQEFAQSQRGQMSADMLSYVISKLGRFVSNKAMRNMIGQAKSSFDVRKVMDEKKILLCNLSKGSLGDINSDLLGFVLVSKMQIAALSRANVAEDKRPDFYLYLDEFQNFTTDSIVTILSEARKYRLNLNLTHQFMQQLEDNIREAVLGNVGTILSYRVGVEDTELLAKQFEPVFTEYDLVNLQRFTAVVRLLVKGTPQRSFSLKALASPSGGNPDVREAIRQFSRNKYGRPVEQVEEQVLQRFSYSSEEGSSKKTKNSVDDYLSESLFDVS
jgi:hypothetical protein